MAKKIETLPEGSEKDLELEKLKLEVFTLRKQFDALQHIGWPTRLANYFQSNLGQILTVAALFTALTAPLFNYIGDKKKEELITVNKSTWGLANNTDSLTNEEILEVGSQDPNIIAPFLLYNLNEQKSYSIPMKKIAAIYPVMYKLNTNQADKSFFESIVFSFISDNKSVIEDQLFTNFNRQVEHSNLNNESVRLDVLTTYVTIIYNCMLQNDKRFIAEKSVIQKQSEGSGGHIYKIILGIISAK